MIIINRTAYLTMLAHCQTAYPLEACGFLAGREAQFFAVYMIENALHSQVTFEMDAQQQLQAMINSEALGLTDMVIYHSHPAGPPRPSGTDRHQAYYPAWPQLIVSLAQRTAPEVRAFMISQTAVRQVAYQIAS